MISNFLLMYRYQSVLFHAINPPCFRVLRNKGDYCESDQIPKFPPVGGERSVENLIFGRFRTSYNNKNCIFGGKNVAKPTQLLAAVSNISVYESLPFTKILPTLIGTVSRRFHILRKVFRTYVYSLVSDVYTRVGMRFYHS